MGNVNTLDNVYHMKHVYTLDNVNRILNININTMHNYNLHY